MNRDVELHLALVQLNAGYAAALDDGRLEDWLSCFTENAWYRIVARENFDRGLPLSTVSLEGIPMMRDRIYGVESTIFHAPYYQRHIVGPTRIVGQEGALYQTETNYMVVRTKRDQPADFLSLGVYRDWVDSSGDTLRLARRFCVFDNDLIPNSLIYPI